MKRKVIVYRSISTRERNLRYTYCNTVGKATIEVTRVDDAISTAFRSYVVLRIQPVI